MRSFTHCKRRAGYTALEITVALTVLGICGFGLVQTYLWGMRAVKVAQQEALAARLMANELEMRRANRETPLAPGVGLPLVALRQEKDVLDGLRGTVDIAPHAGGPAGLLEVRVEVEWTGPGARPLKREATTLIAGERP